MASIVPLTQDSAATKLDNAPPANVDAGTLSADEQAKLNATNTQGEAIQQTIQSEADAEFGVGKVTVGTPILSMSNEDPNAVKSSGANPDKVVDRKPIPNRLKAYPTYIYGLSLHLLSDTEYNDTVKNQTYVPKNVLVASAGRYSSALPRNEFFAEDFYFEDLNLITIIAPNDHSRNTNAIEGSFTLLEPYGFTFVERLLKAAEKIKSQNYLDMPYLLQIDFYTMDEAGTLIGSVEELRKRIPVKLIKMDINISLKGAEYKIGFVPFNHSAYDSSTCSTPANFEILASTVADFFQSVEGTVADELTSENTIHSQVQRDEQAAAEQNKVPIPYINANSVRLPAAAANSAKSSNTTQQIIYTRVKSYGTAINSWNQTLFKYNKIDAPDTYRFEFPRVTLDDAIVISIGDSLFTDQLKHTPRDTKMVDNLTPGEVVKMSKANLGYGRATPAAKTATTNTSTPTKTPTTAPTPDQIQQQLAKVTDRSQPYWIYGIRYEWSTNRGGQLWKATFKPGDYGLTTNQIKAITRYTGPNSGNPSAANTANTLPAAVPPVKNTFSDKDVNLYDTNSALFQVQAGTTIERLLDYIIRNSNYIQDQLAVPEESDYESKKAALKDKPLYWFKIVPTVTLDGFDNRRKVWSRTITYSVIPYKIYNVRIDVGPQGVQLYPVKSYNYIYTGLNDDILDFDIKFNALYYNQVTAYRNSLASITPTANSAVEQGLYPNYNNYKGSEPPVNAQYNAVMPLTMKPIVQNSQSASTGGASTPKEVASIDLEASIMTNSAADMLTVKLKILGDPDYIKQDDVFYRRTNVEITPNVDPRLLPKNGSLVMDDGGLYVQLLFRVPTDIDENTGLMKYDSTYKHSVFSGLYIILKVTSNFSLGKFTQELELVRLPRQVAFDYSSIPENKSDNRTELAGKTQTVPGQTSAPDAPATTAAIKNKVQPAADITQPNEQAQIDVPVQTQEQKDLAAVNDTAPTAPISAATEAPSTFPLIFNKT